MKEILLLSSLLFCTNVMTAWYKKYYLYGWLFVGLTITSLLVHSNHHASYADNFFIMAIVLYGVYLLHHKSTGNLVYISLVVLSFCLVVFLYGYGYAAKQFCFHPDLGNQYHCLLHLLSSVGHHAIILL